MELVKYINKKTILETFKHKVMRTVRLCKLCSGL